MTTEGAPESDFLSIHAAFAESEYGATLAATMRYDKYRPPNISNARWEELLGPDVNNLNHLVDTYRLTENFIAINDRFQPWLLDSHDKAVLKVSAIIHDWGESIFPDVNYNDKTAADEAAERQAFDDNLADFYSGDEETLELINEAVETVIFNKESRLGSIFNTIERMGYLRTGLRAAEHVRQGTAPDCTDGLRWLAADVLSNAHSTHLIMQSRGLLAIQHFLNSHHVDISNAFEASQDPEIFTSHEPEPVANRHIQGMHEASLAWDTWCVGRELLVY